MSQSIDGRIPPQNLAAEQSILGGLMLDQEAWVEVADQISEDDFYSPAHRKIFAAIKGLNLRNQPTDLITVSNHLMDSSDLEAIGGPTYLAEIMDQTPTAANIGSYAKIVHEKSLLRKLIKVSQEISQRSYEQAFANVNDFLDEVEGRIFSLAEEKQLSGLTEASEIVKASIEKLEFLYSRKGDITGVPTGFVDFDKMTAGLQPSEMTILAARPSMGKTALSLNIATHAALREGKKVAYFSVEMAKEAVMMRMLASEARVNLSDLRVGHISDDCWPRLISTAAKMSEAPIYIDDTSGISPFEIRAKARRMKAKSGLDMIIVDYLQLMSLKQKTDSREREVSEISKALKAIAKELQVPVVALAQLNRGVEGRSDRRPMLSDLRESGSIEQDADIIAMIYREDYYDRDNPDVRGLAEVIIGKQRNGPTGTVKLRWQPNFGLFRNNIEAAVGPTPPSPGQSQGPRGNNGGSFNPPRNQGGPGNDLPPPPSGGGPRNFAPSF